MDIATWLRGLDLGQYEAAFRDNDIDAAVLPELTTEDLISIRTAQMHGPAAAVIGLVTNTDHGRSLPAVRSITATPLA